MIVSLVSTNCCIVDCQYALFVRSHQAYLFLSYCGISKHINSFQHIVVLHFVQIQQHPLDYMVLSSFYKVNMVQNRTRSTPLQSLYFAKLPLSVRLLNSLYRKLHKNVKCLKYFFPCLAVFDLLTYLNVELTFLVLNIGFLLIFCTSLTLVLCLLFLRVATFLIRR